MLSFVECLLLLLLLLLPSVSLFRPCFFIAFAILSSPTKRTNHSHGNATTCTTRAAIPSVSRWSDLARDACGGAPCGCCSRAIRLAYRDVLVPSRFFSSLVKMGVVSEWDAPQMRTLLSGGCSPNGVAPHMRWSPLEVFPKWSGPRRGCSPMVVFPTRGVPQAGVPQVGCSQVGVPQVGCSPVPGEGVRQ